jgi:hypothetical protein
MMTHSIPQAVNGRRVFRVILWDGARAQVFERYYHSRAAGVEDAAELVEAVGVPGARVLGVYEGSEAFTLNDKKYRADSESLRVLRGVMESAVLANDGTAVVAMIGLGLKTGRLSEVA